MQTSKGDFSLKRLGVFHEKPAVLYIPPGQEFGVVSDSRFEFAIGAARLKGNTRCASSPRTRSDRSCAAAGRRGGKCIIPCRIPLPAERLILFEVYVRRRLVG